MENRNRKAFINDSSDAGLTKYEYAVIQMLKGICSGSGYSRDFGAINCTGNNQPDIDTLKGSTINGTYVISERQSATSNGFC